MLDILRVQIVQHLAEAADRRLRLVAAPPGRDMEGHRIAAPTVPPLPRVREVDRPAPAVPPFYRADCVSTYTAAQAPSPRRGSAPADLGAGSPREGEKARRSWRRRAASGLNVRVQYAGIEAKLAWPA